MNSQEGGMSDWMALSETRPRQNGPNPGWGSLGSALGGGIQAAGQQANLRGMQEGAQTALAMASARQRVDQNQGIEGMYQQVQQNPAILQQFGLSPQSAGLVKDMALSGKLNLAQVAQGAALGQATNTHADVTNLNTSPAQRNADLASLAPSAFAPKATGVNGSSFAPAIGAAGTANISPLQQNLTQSEIGQHNAMASAAGQNAQTNAARVQAAATKAAAAQAVAGQKLPAGYMWKQGPDGQVITDAQGNPVKVPNPNAGSGEYAQLYAQRVIGAAGELGRETQNIANMPITTAGFLGIGKSTGGLFDTGAGMLGREISTGTQQRYGVAMAGAGRFVATLESMGIRVPSSIVDSVQKSITSQKGDTGNTMLYKMATLRQDLEGIGPAVNLSTNNAVKSAYADMVKQVQQHIPFSTPQVQQYINAQHAGFTGGIKQWMAQQQSGQGNPQFHTPTPPPLPAGFKVVN